MPIFAAGWDVGWAKYFPVKATFPASAHWIWCKIFTLRETFFAIAKKIQKEIGEIKDVIYKYWISYILDFISVQLKHCDD
jgi:hypothetical protein